MAVHRWAKEIKAWADGAEIEVKYGEHDWKVEYYPNWHSDEVKYRIKPTPKEPDFGATKYQKALGKKYKEKIERAVAEVLHKEVSKLTTPKEPQYLYVYQNTGSREIHISKKTESNIYLEYIGKIPLIGVDDAV